MSRSTDTPSGPPIADSVGVLGLTIALVGLALTLGRIGYAVFQMYGWWSGPVYTLAGCLLLAAALLGRITYRRVTDWRLDRAAERIRQRGQE